MIAAVQKLVKLRHQMKDGQEPNHDPSPGECQNERTIGKDQFKEELQQKQRGTEDQLQQSLRHAEQELTKAQDNYNHVVTERDLLRVGF